MQAQSSWNLSGLVSIYNIWNLMGVHVNVFACCHWYILPASHHSLLWLCVSIKKSTYFWCIFPLFTAGDNLPWEGCSHPVYCRQNNIPILATIGTSYINSLIILLVSYSDSIITLLPPYGSNWLHYWYESVLFNTYFQKKIKIKPLYSDGLSPVFLLVELLPVGGFTREKL